MSLDECFNKLLQISDEDIRNLEKYEKFVEMTKGFSRPDSDSWVREELGKATHPGYVSAQKSGVNDETRS